MSDQTESTTERGYELDDEYDYHGYLVGRPTRTVEMGGADGTVTIKEGTLTSKIAHKDDIWTARQNDGWTDFFAGPDGGVGFGIGDDNSGGVVLPYDLVGVIEFPEPMTEKEAEEWFDDEQLLEYADTTVESDVPAEDLLEELR